MFASPTAKCLIYSSKIFPTITLFLLFFKISTNCFPVIDLSSPILSATIFLKFPIDEYASKQPLFPQLHFRPPISIVICPNSKPGLLADSSKCPSQKTAPPIPVPIHKKTLSTYPFKLPYSFSAIAAHFASLSKYIGTLYFFFNSPTILNLFNFKLSAFTITPFFITPGDAIPINSISSIFASFVSKTLLINLFI